MPRQELAKDYCKLTWLPITRNKNRATGRVTLSASMGDSFFRLQPPSPLFFRLARNRTNSREESARPFCPFNSSPVSLLSHFSSCMTP